MCSCVCTLTVKRCAGCLSAIHATDNRMNWNPFISNSHRRRQWWLVVVVAIYICHSSACTLCAGFRDVCSFNRLLRVCVCEWTRVFFFHPRVCMYRASCTRSLSFHCVVYLRSWSLDVAQIMFRCMVNGRPSIIHAYQALGGSCARTHSQRAPNRLLFEETRRFTKKKTNVRILNNFNAIHCFPLSVPFIRLICHHRTSSRVAIAVHTHFCRYLSLYCVMCGGDAGVAAMENLCCVCDFHL